MPSRAARSGTKSCCCRRRTPKGKRVVDACRGSCCGPRACSARRITSFTRWVSSDLTEAERGDSRNYRPGTVDMIQFHQKGQGHNAGSRIDGRRGQPRHRSRSTRRDKFQAYRKETVNFAEGDILRFTANGMTLDGHQIRNGSAYKIAGFTAKGITAGERLAGAEGFRALEARHRDIAGLAVENGHARHRRPVVAISSGRPTWSRPT